MKILILQHVPFEGPAVILEWAHNHGIELEIHCFATNNEAPNIASFDGFIIMGGPMSVNDDIAWLSLEKTLLSQILQIGAPVFGICLGAQLIADCLGAVVRKHSCREIGWFPIQKIASSHPLLQRFPDEFVALHWHGDTFDIPKTATHLFESSACSNQGFVVGENIVGLQFHLEFNRDTALRVGDACADELSEGGPWVQSIDQIIADEDRFTTANSYAFQLLDALFLPASEITKTPR